RTTPEIKNILTKFGGSLANAGAVSRLFEKKAIIIISADQISEDALVDIVVDAGADDVVLQEDVFQITAQPEAYEKIQEAINSKGLQVIESEVKFVPSVTVEISDPLVAEKVMKILDAFEAHDDVQNVNSNFELSPDLNMG
ncbi:MAG TPA: YebC/PmpR family DNA-binding transcriptional regulator, partial [Leptospiraceae bacterium]|nr:YebC/PmpR family DNA-binding transcriptional regulator [Leptospiraceae bacterium]